MKSNPGKVYVEKWSSPPLSLFLPPLSFHLITLHAPLSFSVAVIDMKSNPGKVYRGEVKEGKPDVTVTIDDGDFVDLASGKTAGTTGKHFWRWLGG